MTEKEQLWYSRYLNFIESGLSQRKWCSENHISSSSFAYWIKRFTDYDEIRNNGMELSNRSDLSLGKKMSFDVYTRRWGHKDRYTIMRTIDGWDCGYISINGGCEKNGEGSLFLNLEHDGFFPQEMA